MNQLYFLDVDENFALEKSCFIYVSGMEDIDQSLLWDFNVCSCALLPTKAMTMALCWLHCTGPNILRSQIQSTKLHVHSNILHGVCVFQ